jgi:ABC-type Mn2+/Zn2+ transport system ATPase subunit
MSEPVVAVAGLRVVYERTVALDGLDLVVDAPCVLGIVGSNGAGKSTLLKAIAGIVKPAAGSVRVFGAPAGRLPRGTIGYVPQVDDVDWSFPATVDDVVAMGRYPYLRPWRRFSSADRRAVSGAIASLDLRELAGRAIADLSGGQRQRVFVARALAQQPRMLILDEPTTGIDAATATLLRSLVRDLAAGGMTVLMTSHELDDAEAWFDRVVVVERRIVADGTPAALRASGAYGGLRSRAGTFR